MSGNTKPKALSIGELKQQLERKIADSEINGDRVSAKGTIGLPKRHTQASNSSDRGIPKFQMVNEDAEREFDRWCRSVRSTGPFFGMHGQRSIILQERRRALFRNCDAMNREFAERLARFFCERWIYLESEAQEIFGEYLNPLLAADYLYRFTASSEMVKKVFRVAVDSPGEVTILFPSLTLIEMLSWSSSKLTFIVGFAVAKIQEDICNSVSRGERPEYPPVWLIANNLLVDAKSALHQAFKATIPPERELQLVAQHFGLAVKTYGAPESIIQWHRESFGEELGSFKKLFPTSSKSGAVVLVSDDAQKIYKVVCSPAVLQAVVDSLSAYRVSEVSKEQIQAAQSVVLALGDHERHELVASVYGAATRGEFNVTSQYNLTVACLNKIVVAQWPGIAPSVTRELIVLLFESLFSRYERIIGANNAKCCVPEDLFHQAQSVLRLLGNLRSIDLIVRAFGAAPDLEWIQMNGATKFLALESYSYRIGFEARSGNSYSLATECLVGWFCGFVDLAFELDKKGVKTKIKAFRVNQAALRAALLPEVRASDVSTSDRPLKGNATTQYSCKVEVLPNGEILCPPDLHPALRFCVATISPYVRANTYTIPVGPKAYHRALQLDSKDILEFLSVISRNPVPKIICDKLFCAAEASPPSGIFVPSFILTNTTHQRAELILNKLDERRFFAIEIAPEVWGIFDKYYGGSSFGLEEYEASSSNHDVTALKNILKNSATFGFRLSTDLEPFRKIGKVPAKSRGNGYQRGNLNKPSLESLSVVREFFELHPDDQEWQNDQVGVDIFSLLPREIRATKAFQVAMAPCLAITQTKMDLL